MTKQNFAEKVNPTLPLDVLGSSRIAYRIKMHVGDQKLKKKILFGHLDNFKRYFLIFL